MAEWEQEIGPIPGAISLNIEGMAAGPPGKPIEIWVQGQDMDEILVAADALVERLKEFDGVSQMESDFRPGKNVYKVRSKTNHSEIQVCAVSGKILNTDVRRSDFLENLHDGSFFGEWMHDKVLPVVAVSNIILAISGLYLWLGPKFRRKKKTQKA